jgi:hypothetical protein
MPAELVALMQRIFNSDCCCRGLITFEDPRARAGVQIVLAEMHDVRAQIDAFLAAARASRQK